MIVAAVTAVVTVSSLIGPGLHAGPDWAGPALSSSPDSVANRPVDDLPPPGVGSRPERLLPPVVPRRPSSAWRPLMVQDDVGGNGGRRTPVRWDPCRPITYVVNPKGAPEGGARLIDEAFADIERATGLRFVKRGTTKEPVRAGRPPYQRERYGERWAPLLVGWGDPRAPGAALAGADGAALSRNNTITIAGRPAVFVSGVVLLDALAVRQFLADPRTRPFARSQMLFHLAQVAGLGPVEDSSQLLGGRFSEEVRTLREGDLAGLAALGNGPCAPWL